MPFQTALLSWYGKHGRKLPWRETRDPYSILISEFMLQQTQVDRVIPKYAAWLKKFPDFKTLAAASRADVLRMWSGLGYNNRAVRLHALAKLLVEEHDGKLPEEEETLRKLPGIGPYTAGAIMAFAFNRPGRCVDVNIERIIRRIQYPKNKKNIGKGEIEDVFLRSFPPGAATSYANALMDLGSLICTATRPKCDVCPVYDACKSKGERPDEAALRVKKRQSTFLHSNRWWRGRILKALAQDAELSEKGLLARISVKMKGERRDEGVADEEKFSAALTQLKREGLVAGKKRLSL